MKHFIRTTAIIFILISFLFIQNAKAQLPEGNSNPLFKEYKIKNYIPHMSWAEVEAALKTTDMVIIPVGSIEQHGKHLPLGTDRYIAIELSKLIAQKADVLVAPSVLAGLSEHHMGFPGTLTLSPETFEAVVYESALSLINHGFKKIMILNGHGGNSTSVANIIQKINQTTPAIALDLMKIDVPQKKSPYPSYEYDWHAGIGETSLLLYITGSLVQISQAENPVLTFPPDFKEIEENRKKYSKLSIVASAYLFRPEKTGKKASSREMSSNGVFTTGNVKESSAERGKWEVKDFIEAAVKFIEEWKELGKE
jgi:creatinine amidohydrolase